MAKINDQCLALSAMAQAAYLVDQIANGVSVDERQVEPLLDSLFTFDADSTEAIYGGNDPLSQGAKTMQALLNQAPSTSHRVMMAYMNGMMTLEQQLAKKPSLLDVIASRLQHINTHRKQFIDNETVKYGQLASVYTDTISTLSFRIKVLGSADTLQNAYNADRIRSLLFTGVRSAILWRQLGGRRWHLLLKRSQIARQLNTILHSTND